MRIKGLFHYRGSRPLGVVSLVMFNVVAVDSLRSLPFAAKFGFSLVFYYLVALLVFLLPVAWVSAELATTWPSKGGIYVWVREAFGGKWGMIIIWLQWIYNVVWYPTILSFIVTALVYLIDPQLTHNRYFMLGSVLACFWGITAINLLGIRVSSLISLLGAIVGTLLPMLLIIVLGIIWSLQGHTLAIRFDVQDFFPSWEGIRQLVFFTVILFGLAGIELSAVHAEEVNKPAYAYPRAILYSSLIIILTLIGSSLVIAMVVPVHKLDIIAGVEQALQIFFSYYRPAWLGNVVIMMIVIGGMSCVSTWVIGPTKGLLAAAQDGNLPKLLTGVNRKGVPANILCMQALLFTGLSSLFVLLPTVSNAYWVLTAITAQLAMLVYVIMFVAAWHLRTKYPNITRPYRIPGPNWCIRVICSIGIIACSVTILLGFIPPSNMKWVSTAWYEVILFVGTASLITLPFFLSLNYKK